jgi:hypothetical protein
MRKITSLLAVFALVGFAASAYAVDTNNDGAQGPDVVAPGTVEGPVLDGGDIFAWPVEGIDSFSVVYFPYWWNAGDTAVGSRTATVDNITSAELNMVLTYTSLSCDTDEFDFYINDINVGHFSISAADGLGPIVRDFSFASIPSVGGDYTFRWTVSETVAGGCGSISFDTVGGCMVSISGGATATEAVTWGTVKSLYH